MNSSDSRVGYRFYILLRQLLPKTKYTSWLLLLAMAIATMAGESRLIVAKVSAQTEVTPVVSLDKNIIYVNVESGDDNQSGTKSSPLKTITQALKIAKSGTTIKLASGTYNENSGEVFPLVLENQITLQGNAQNQGHNIKIEGGGNFVSPTGAGQNVAIAVLKDAVEITGVTVTNDHSRGHGLWVESANPKIVSNTLTRNGNTGMSVNGNSQPILEDNYFYNNSGNGLLVYGTSQPQIIDNTFEQTGFGVSLVQDTVATVENNYFDSNRIGIILEGNSQAVLRDNEIINSQEAGLTAIAQSSVDLGTDNEPGNNVFRSNRKLDIQNATDNEIVAVGTETNGDTEGAINFERGNFVARANTERELPPLLPPLEPNNQPARVNVPTSENSDLPSPPPVLETKTSTKEFVFTPNSATISPSPDTEPVPFLPESLGSNNSQISSLSDVLGGRSAAVKYKVLVEAENEFDRREVRSLYPEAFNTIYQGESVLQVGAFNNWDKAKQAQRSLENLGLDAHILE